MFGGFKPFAKQKVGAPVVDLACDSSGEMVAAITVSTLFTYSQRQQLAAVEHEGNRMVRIAADSSRIVLVAFDGLHCYDLWGNPKWAYATERDVHDVALAPDGSRTLVADGDRLVLLDRDGEPQWEAMAGSFVGGVAFAPDGNCLCGFERGVRCYDAAGAQQWELRSGQLVLGVAANAQHVACSSGKQVYCLTSDGQLLWREEVGPLRSLRFTRGGGTLLVATDGGIHCFEVNGQLLWQVEEEKFVETAAVTASGEMVALVAGGEVFGRWELRLLDREGLVLETYSSREEIGCLALPGHGGELVAGIGSRVCWFRNGEFLKRGVSELLAQVRQLYRKVTAYEPEPEGVTHALEQAEAKAGGRFDALKEAFSALEKLRAELEALHQQHVGYMDQLPRFMQQLGLPEGQPEALASWLYPFYALHQSLSGSGAPGALDKEISEYLARLRKVADSFGDREGSEELERKLACIEEALAALPAERKRVRALLKERRTRCKQVEQGAKQVALDWMTSGSAAGQPGLLQSVREQEAASLAACDRIREQVEGITAFVEMSDRFEQLRLEQLAFSADKEGVKLQAQLHNTSDEQLEGVVLRLKLEGSGLALEAPADGVVRPGLLAAGERTSVSFAFSPLGRDPSRAVLVAQYRDATGQHCTASLGAVDAALPGCYMVPLPLSEEEHGELRAEHREQSASSELRLDAVTLAAATEALEGLTGLAVCGQRHEEGSDISYLAARSNLDETVYLAMVVAKPHGDEGVELELLCRASQGEAAQELLEELQSALRNRLLEAGGRLA